MAQYHLMFSDASADYSLCNTHLIKQLKMVFTRQICQTE